MACRVADAPQRPRIAAVSPFSLSSGPTLSTQVRQPLPEVGRRRAVASVVEPGAACAAILLPFTSEALSR